MVKKVPDFSWETLRNAAISLTQQKSADNANNRWGKKEWFDVFYSFLNFNIFSSHHEFKKKRLSLKIKIIRRAGVIFLK